MKKPLVETFEVIFGYEDTLKHYPCPLCHATPELIQRTVGEVHTKVVSCMTVRTEDDLCPLYFPPENFYKATKGEAIRVWTELCDRANKKTP